MSRVPGSDDGRRSDRRRRWGEATVTTAVLAVLLLAAAVWGLARGWDDGSVYALAGSAAMMAVLTTRSARDRRR